MGVDKVGAQRNGAAVMLLGVRPLPGQFEHRTQIEMGKRGIRRTFQDLLELQQRFVETPERTQSAPEVVARLDIAGVKRHGAFEGRYGIGKRSIGGENNPAVVVSLGKIRIESDGPAEQPRRVGPSELMGDHAAEVKRPRIVGITIADGLVETLSLGETAGAMMRHRSCKHLL